MQKGGLRRILCALLAIALLLAVNTPALAAAGEKTTVRVGYFDLGAYYTVEPDGTLVSYDAAFLDEVSHYTNYEFEYVDCGTWNHALELLEAHEIDLIGTMQWTLEREERYEICDASYGYSVAELVALQHSPYVYEDNTAIDGATIGCIDGYVVEHQLNEFLTENGLTATIEKFETQTELDAALERGQIDLLAANAHAVHPEWKVIEKFSYAPFYFASWKGNAALTQAISEAIIQIHIYEPDFAESLIKEFLPLLVSSPYTKEELDCIAQNRAYTVYFDAVVPPLAWCEEGSDTMHGVLVEVCRQLEVQTGLSLTVKEYTEGIDWADSSAVGYRTLYYGAQQDASEEFGVTNSILDQEFELYHRVGGRYVAGGAYTIAVVSNRDGLVDYLAEAYPNCTLIECGTPAECMERLSDGTSDLAFLNSNIAERIMIVDSLDQVSAIPLTQTTFGIALQFFGEDAEVLAGIVDKGMQLVDKSEINDVLLSSALSTAPELSLSYLVRQHLLLTILILVLVLLVLAALAVLYTYAKVMRRQRTRVEQANQARTEFFARMSHDMRTPMNGILGMIELTRQASDLDEVKCNMDKAASAGEYMLSLINDTLDLQRLESGKLHFNLQAVEAVPFFRGLLEMEESTAAQKGLSFQSELSAIPTHSFLQMDPIRVKQILTNLTSNAIKFTPSGGMVRVSIQRLSGNDEAEQYRFCVQDSGVGMSRDFIEKNLFRAYAQEHNAVSDQYAGSGLGLAITKNITELMGGHIAVESELGEGTTFTVELSFAPVDGAAAEESLQAQENQTTQVKNGLKGKTILLAEDHPLNAEIVIRLLKKADCAVTWAQDGEQAVSDFQAAEPGHFDAILMDIRMPVMDGLAAARAIRALERPDAKQIPIIALSANAYDEDVKACLAVGMSAHLAKPIDSAALYDTLMRYLA